VENERTPFGNTWRAERLLLKNRRNRPEKKNPKRGLFEKKRRRGRRGCEGGSKRAERKLSRPFRESRGKKGSQKRPQKRKMERPNWKSLAGGAR